MLNIKYYWMWVISNCIFFSPRSTHLWLLVVLEQMSQAQSYWSSHWPALCVCVSRKYARWTPSSCHCHQVLMMHQLPGVSSIPLRISVLVANVCALAMPASAHRMASLEWVEPICTTLKTVTYCLWTASVHISLSILSHQVHISELISAKTCWGSIPKLNHFCYYDYHLKESDQVICFSFIKNTS